MSRTILRTPTEFILLADAAPVIGGQITYLQGRQYINGSVTGSKIKILLPSNLQISNTTTHEHCPTQYAENDIVQAVGPISDSYGKHYYVLIDGTKIVQRVEDECASFKISTQTSQGSSGEKGEKGDFGFGDKGDKGDAGDVGASGSSGSKGQKGAAGDQGDKGSKGEEGDKGGVGDKGSKGSTGDVGEKGSAGDAGTAGSKGAPGENIDWNSTQQSIRIGGVTFGPRLIGVCQNGTYKYIYVFASDPQ